MKTLTAAAKLLALSALGKRLGGRKPRSRAAAVAAVTDWAESLLSICVGGAG